MNHDLNHELELARIYQSPAIMVRVLDHLAAEVARLDEELARVRGDNQLLMVKVSVLQEHLARLNVLHMNSKAGHGRATMAGEHTTPVETLEKYGQHS